MSNRRSLLATACVALTLGGCALGPEYAGPPTAAPNAEAGGTFVRGTGFGQSPVIQSARWWETFNDPLLTSITEEALACSPTVGAAIAKVRQARSEVKLQFSNLLPTASGSALYAKAHLPSSGESGGESQEGSLPSDLELYSQSYNASWEIDIFGGQRRALEAAQAAKGGVEATLEDAQVSLSAEVVTAYINLRDRQRRIALASRAAEVQRKTLALAKERFAGGTATRLDAARIENQLETTLANVPPLLAQRDVYLNELATLTGREPGALDGMLRRVKPIPLPPARVNVGDPASLLQRRPDIRAAERTLASNTAKIGQAEAKRFPSVKFMGIIGLGGTRSSDLTNLDNYTTLLAPQISWNFLDFGRNQARVRQAEATADQSEADYRDKVLRALRDAEDSLTNFRHGRDRVARLARAKKAADEAATLAAERYAAGTAALTDLLDTQRQQLGADQDLSQAIAQLSSYYVAINKSLGLGWSGPGGA